MAAVRLLADLLRHGGSEDGRTQLQDGRVLPGHRREDFDDPANGRLEGKCLDLESASRQLAFSGANQKAGVIASGAARREAFGTTEAYRSPSVESARSQGLTASPRPWRRY